MHYFSRFLRRMPFCRLPFSVIEVKFLGLIVAFSLSLQYGSSPLTGCAADIPPLPPLEEFEPEEEEENGLR